ncbi:threonine aldolase family protein [Saccharobesus litoralis]|uniref:threonine aldolase family protein n=1 Tax=Saccharobesus litoralis TaxID=2172099 RepID=UPI00131F1684|nr:GntG family PLP-dependent aldolase [Saccharobesus litoralis]
MQNKKIDLRSDTMSEPSADMLPDLASLDYGVDVFGENEQVNLLQNYAADLFGKPAALLFPTGVMANLAALIVHTPKGQEAIVGKSSHIFAHEGGNASVLGGIPLKPVDDEGGIFDLNELAEAISDGAFFSTKTGLICLENTHNDKAGIAHKPDALQPIYQLAQQNNIPVHLDGARLLNACAKYDIAANSFANCADSIMICLNKGVGAPMGALLIGETDFIEQAKGIRKLLGGSLNQPSVMAHMALKGLQNYQAKLSVDNANAAKLVELLSPYAQFDVKPTEQGTNIVYIFLRNPAKPATEYIPEFEKYGVHLLANQIAYRAVFHSGVSAEDVEQIAQAFVEIFAVEHQGQQFVSTKEQG